MTQPGPGLSPSRASRLARWTVFAGVLGACVSWFAPHYVPVGSGAPMIPAIYFATNFQWRFLADTTLWPFALLVLYIFLGEAGGPRGRAVVTWITALWLGLTALATSCIQLHSLLPYLRSAFASSGADRFLREWGATLATRVLFIAGGFVFFAVPFLRPSRAALPACVALSGTLLFAASLAGAGHSFSMGLMPAYAWGYWLSLASKGVMAAGGIWQTILILREKDAQEEAP